MFWTEDHLHSCYVMSNQPKWCLERDFFSLRLLIFQIFVWVANRSLLSQGQVALQYHHWDCPEVNNVFELKVHWNAKKYKSIICIGYDGRKSIVYEANRSEIWTLFMIGSKESKQPAAASTQPSPRYSVTLVASAMAWLIWAIMPYLETNHHLIGEFFSHLLASLLWK